MIALNPKNSHAYHNRGISYDKKAEFEKAIADFTKGKAKERESERAVFGLRHVT